MKILILTDEYPPLIGGAGTVAKQIYDGLLRYGHVVSIFTPNRKSSSHILFRFFWFFYYFRLNLIKKIYNSDKVIINDLRSAYFISFLSIAININLNKCVYIIHGTEYDIVYNASIRNKLILLPYFYNKFLLKVKKIVAVSEFTRLIFIRKCTVSKKIINKITTSYCGISKEIKPFNNNYIDDGIFRFVSVSRLEARKGYIEMISIFKKIIKIKPNTQWFIYGDGSLREKIQDLIKINNLNNHVYLLGSKDRLEIYNNEFSKNQFDLFWLLPNKPEAFGLVYLESSITGTPALGIDQYGIKEAVNNLYYTNINHLLSLMDDIKSRKSYYYHSSIKFAKKFDSDIFINSLLD